MAKSEELRAALAWGLQEAHTEPIHISEVLRFDRNNLIRLFEFNGKWSFCLTITPKRSEGVHYGPFLKFCDPYPDRQTALEAARDKIVERCEDGPVIAWAKYISGPQQIGF